MCSAQQLAAVSWQQLCERLLSTVAAAALGVRRAKAALSSG
jgi:hypothetical protein